MNQLAERIMMFCEKSLKQCLLLSGMESATLLRKMAAKNNFDISARYWWANTDMTDSSSYNTLDDWEALMRQHLCKFSAKIYLVISDDDFFPWPVLQVDNNDLTDIIRNQEIFEYFVFDDSLDWVLFDTHDNSLFLKRT